MLMRHQLLPSGNCTIQAWKRCMFLAQHCTNVHQLKATHAIFITQGLHLNNYAISKLIAFCAQSDSGSLAYASDIFNQIQSPNLYIYNSLIRGYSHSSQPQWALRYFDLMVKIGDFAPDHHTFHFLLLACANASWVRTGKQIHNQVVRNGLALSDSYVQTALIRLYAECRILGDARNLFYEIPQRDLIKWNVLMNGYLRCGLASDALMIFRDMFVFSIEPDEFCITTGLKACAQAGAVWQGKWVHEYIKKKKEWEMDVFIGTALVDMYAKCGHIDIAVKVFNAMPKRNLFSWAALIGGFAVHGYARKAISCLERMKVDDGLKPDGVVLLGVLMACTHAGLVEEGKLLFKDIETQYGVVPKHEHYGCMVDLLCRAGRLNEAFKIIQGMPMKPRASVWGALLSGCRSQNNINLAELAVGQLLLLEAEEGIKDDGVYVQLSDIYLGVGRGEDAVRTRKMIGDRGIKKTPGCSMVEVDGKVNEFVSGDASHSHIVQICAMIELLSHDLTRKIL